MCGKSLTLCSFACATTVDDAIQQIVEGKLDPHDFPAVVVFRHEYAGSTKLFSLSNRRLVEPMSLTLARSAMKRQLLQLRRLARCSRRFGPAA